MISRKIEISTLLLVGILMISSLNYAATEVLWSDNFNDGNYDGWDVASYSMTCVNTCPWESITPTIYVENGELVIDSSRSGSGINWVVRDANVSYGQWSYDMKMTDITHDGFGFSKSDMSTAWDFPGTTTVQANLTGYAFFTVNYRNTGLDDFMPTPGFALFKWLNNGSINASQEDQLETLTSISMTDAGISVTGTYHIAITRTTDDNMSVSIDGKKIMSTIDNEYQTSEKIALFSWHGITRYDNFTVTKKVPTTTTTITTTASPPPSTNTTTTESSPDDETSSFPVLATFVSLGILTIIIRRRK